MAPWKPSDRPVTPPRSKPHVPFGMRQAQMREEAPAEPVHGVSFEPLPAAPEIDNLPLVPRVSPEPEHITATDIREAERKVDERLLSVQEEQAIDWATRLIERSTPTSTDEEPPLTPASREAVEAARTLASGRREVVAIEYDAYLPIVQQANDRAMEVGIRADKLRQELDEANRVIAELELDLGRN